MTDTIDLAAVNDDQQLDHDEADPLSGSAATEGGVDDDLTDVYDNPGDIISGDLG